MRLVACSTWAEGVGGYGGLAWPSLSRQCSHHFSVQSGSPGSQPSGAPGSSEGILRYHKSCEATGTFGDDSDDEGNRARANAVRRNIRRLENTDPQDHTSVAAPRSR